MRSAFITGVCGQDGAYLAELLLAKGYAVFGGVRRSSSDYTSRLRELDVLDKVRLINFDLTDQYSVQSLIMDNQFDEVYNLAAQSFVGASWEAPIATSMVDGIGPLYLLDAIKRFSPKTRFYQASTSELYVRTTNQTGAPLQNLSSYTRRLKATLSRWAVDLPG